MNTEFNKDALVTAEARWDVLRALVVAVIENQRDQHLLLLENLGPDRGEGPDTWLGFKHAPAAVRNHHAFLGGLVAHLLEMWEVYHHFKTILPGSDDITDERVLKLILYHDLHKAYLTYRVLSWDPFQVEGYKSDHDRLFDQDKKSASIIQTIGIKMDQNLYHAFWWSEGGFSGNKAKDRSPLAILAYLLDEMSGNILAKLKKYD